MKAILILDKMPKSCMECRLKYLDTGANVYCCVWDGSEILKRGKDEWCPLKPMKRRMYKEEVNSFGYSYGTPYISGWNDCIDEILREE